MVYVPWMRAADRADIMVEGAMHLLEFHSEHCAHSDNLLTFEEAAVRIRCDACHRGAAVEDLLEDEPYIVGCTVVRFGSEAQREARKSALRAVAFIPEGLEI